MWIVLIFLAITVPLSLVTGWMFMLAVGVAHHEWLPMMPTIGYWPSVVIVLLLNLAFGDYSPRGND